MYRAGNNILLLNNKPIYISSIHNAVWSGLTSYYRLDETSGTVVTDSKGGHNGTANNERIFTTAFTGKNNHCADFSAYADYINCGNHNDFNIETGSYSISLWIYGKVSYTPYANAILAKTNGGGASSSYGWFLTSHSIAGVNGVGIIASTSAAHFAGMIPNSEVTDNQWNHYVFTMPASASRTTNTNFKGYLNGVAKSLNFWNTITNCNGSITNSVDFHISGESDDGGGVSSFRRQVDEIAIWKGRELSATDAATLYNAGAGLFY